ncbi:hypothetical protein Taro_044649 [Colocasia esculenta]|uniref:NAC domain-containing protein n=1 Tax=Colocasia esculenta TaxID=4460 RepID=A0A843WP84_COLES|nr:hypothetical protein [Colocasia esculenta]
MDQHRGHTLAGREDGSNLELPPGFRFHPTDEELITHYLSRKVADGGFVTRAIGDIDLNKIEPWDIPWRAKMGEKEWYFFAVRDRKYPTGLRTNRATDAGYWKATGKDREINRGSNQLVGMKKTLVFYRGRAPKGEKTNWVMHEYRLDGKLSLYNFPKTAKNEWVICRVFQKSFSAATGAGAGGVGGGKKVSGLARSSSYEDDIMMLGGASNSSLMLPSVDHTQFNSGTFGKMVRASQAASGAARVTCFSSPMEGQTGYIAADPLFSASANHSSEVSWPPPLLHNLHPDGGQIMGSLRLSGTGLVQLLQSHGYGVKEGYCKTEEVGGSLSQETGLTSDMNPEISSPALSKREVNKLSLDAQDVPSVPPLVNVNLSMDDIWNY